ncbi:MAG: DUF3617 family protein [Alphaproteobacteria bacterium]|nr:DUF3617 family protein [Alphaproteobacteria bacterium]
MGAASKNLRDLCIAVATFVLPLSHASAFEFEPGTWKEIETGTEDGKWVSPSTNVTCMTPEQAEDPLKALAPDKDLADLRGRCKTLEAKKSDAAVTMRVQCGDPAKLLMDFSVEYTLNSERSYTGKVKYVGSISGKTTTTEKKIEGRWMSSICVRKRAEPPRG